MCASSAGTSIGDWDAIGNPAPIVTGIPRTSGRHSGCRTRFGPDGYLWITTGDAATPTTRRTWRRSAARCCASRPTANPAPGNMGVPSCRRSTPTASATRRASASGRATARPFLVEHGPDRDDEITVVTAGGNGGWAPGPGLQRERPDDRHRLRRTSCSRCGSRAARPSPRPVATFVTDADWGDRSGQLAVAVLKGEQLRMINVDRRRAGPGRRGAHRLRPDARRRRRPRRPPLHPHRRQPRPSPGGATRPVAATHLGAILPIRRSGADSSRIPQRSAPRSGAVTVVGQDCDGARHVPPPRAARRVARRVRRPRVVASG